MEREQARHQEPQQARPSVRPLLRHASRVPQARLAVGAVDDPLEREADRVANEVAAALGSGGMPARFASPAGSRIARRSEPAPPAAPAGGELDADTAGRIRASSAGELIADDIRRPIEQTLDADLSTVRIHRNSALAPRLGAVAFTLGRDVHFARDEYRPGDGAGRWLLGHELAHVVQQTGSASPATVRRKDDAALIGANQVGDAPLDLRDAYAYRYVFRALKPAEVRAISKETLTVELANAVNATKTDPNFPFDPPDVDAQKVLTAYKAKVDATPQDESFQTYQAVWIDNTLGAVPSRYTLINHLFNRLKARFLTTARQKHKRLDGEIAARERDMSADVGAGPDGPTRVQFAAALRSMPGFKELIAAVKAGGVKRKAPVIGFKEVGWSDGGKLVDKIQKKPGGPDDSPANDTANEFKLMQEKVQKADDFYRALVEPDVLEKIPRPTINYFLIKAFDVVGGSVDGNGKKAYVANQDGPAVNVGQGVFTHIIIHEIGHYIEDNLPRDQWASIALLLRARHTTAGGGNLVAGPGGARQKGAYPATGEYTSRAYATGTEMSSMTLENLSQSGQLDAMIDNDPQQVAVVLRTLRPKAYAAHRDLRAFDKFLP